MAARLVGLVASCGDALRAELLAAGALPALVAALEATEALTTAVATPGGGGLVPPYTVRFGAQQPQILRCASPSDDLGV